MGGAEVSDEVLEYEYRKQFGLSYEELMNEPYQVYINDWVIMEAKARAESRKQRALENINKHGG